MRKKVTLKKIKFNPKTNDWYVHINRLDEFFIANEIDDVREKLEIF